MLETLSEGVFIYSVSIGGKKRKSLKTQLFGKNAYTEKIKLPP